MNEQTLREQICHIGRLMHQAGHIDGTSGNISARLDSDRILATPSGLAKGFMTPDQILLLDMDGQKIGPPTTDNTDLLPTSEILMHLECYRRRDDVGGVVHAHPPTAVALTIAGIPFDPCVIPEVVIVLGVIPTTPYATPASAENRDAITQLIREHDVIMLAHHGSLTAAVTVWDAYLRLESLEHTARILYMAHQLGQVNTLPPHQIEKLLQARRELGLWRPGDEERFRAACGKTNTGE